MLSTWIQSKKDEEGFTLIELLVVVIIIGILAAIAIPVFLNQRESAWQGATESDVRNAAIAMETCFTRTSAYPASTTINATGDLCEPANGSPIQVVVSPEVELVVATTGETYTITGNHERLGDGVAVYESASGGLVDPDEG